jgi:proton-translocating NADH-quinone oxidoreductase chain L
MYLLVVFIPLASAAVVGLLGRHLGARGAGLLASGCIGVTFLLSTFIFFEVALGGSKCNIKLLDWFDSGLFTNSWGFLFDTVTCVMLIVVTSVSFLVHMYSIGYMGEDPHFVRFMSYLSLFTFFMLCLVTADNFVQMFLGWEGVGLASYLLINFWFTRIEANRAAIKAVIVNRIGDFGLGLALVVIYTVFKSVNFNCVFGLVSSLSDASINIFGYSVNAVLLISLLLFLGAVGKSAQLGLHTWLPDAMEGPTPVSALIHAATMVTAGVFVLIRCSPLLEYSGKALTVVTIVGALTAFFAGTVGVFQNDLKRVIAYSTCSQLGYMVFACGLSNYSVGMFHLMNHAFFKALLFLSAGVVIHAMCDEQDMRRMGGLRRLLPVSYVMFVIGSLALMGFPFTTGFYSKDAILEVAYVDYYVEGIFSYWLGVLAAFCTAFYSFRLLYLTFLSETNSSKRVLELAHEGPPVMLYALVPLCVGSIFVGYVFKDMFIGLGTSFWNNALYEYSFLGDALLLEAEFLPGLAKLSPVIVSIIGAYVAYALYASERLQGQLLKLLAVKGVREGYGFFVKKWMFDVVYNRYIVGSVLSFGYAVSFKGLDRGAIELIGPTGIVRGVQRATAFVSQLQSGYLYHYIFLMVVGIVLFASALVAHLYSWPMESSAVVLVMFYGILWGLIEK